MQAVEAIGGLQTQEARPAYIALWSRIKGFERDQLHAAMHDRSLVRSTLLRGTLHTVSANDFVQWRPVIQPVLDAGLKTALNAVGGEVDRPAVIKQARQLLRTDGHTFAQIRQRLSQKLPDVNDRALGFTTRMAVPLLMVPTDDRWSFTADSQFILAETWLKQPVTTEAAAASAGDLALRYLAAFGPASPADFGKWTGLRGAKQIFTSIQDQLIRFTDPTGRELFDLPDAPRPAADTPAPARLLPDFESTLLAYADRSRIIADPRLIAGKGNLRIRPAFTWQGFVVGVWRCDQQRGGATITLSPFHKLPKRAVDALSREAEGMAKLLVPQAKSVKITLDAPTAA